MATAVAPEPKSPAALLPSDVLYEVINGQLVELSMSVREIRLANSLSRFLNLSLGKNPPGEVFVEMLFRLEPDDRLDRRPNVAFVPYDRFPDRVVPATEAWAVSPSLAVEIVSKTNTANDIQDKILDYFQHGVDLVWIIYPKTRTIQVYEGLKNIRFLDEKDTLEGGQVLPGFRLPVQDLFALLGPTK